MKPGRRSASRTLATFAIQVSLRRRSSTLDQGTAIKSSLSNFALGRAPLRLPSGERCTTENSEITEGLRLILRVLRVLRVLRISVSPCLRGSFRSFVPFDSWYRGQRSVGLRVSVSPCLRVSVWFLPFVRSVRLVVQGPTERRPFALRSGRQVVGLTMFHSDLPDRGHRPLPLRNGPAGFGGAPTGPGASGSG